MQVVEGGDGGREVALGVIQLLDVSRDLFDLREEICCRTKGHNFCGEKLCKHKTSKMLLAIQSYFRSKNEKKR